MNNNKIHVDAMEKLRILFTRCRGILNRGYTSTRQSGIPWLNDFCAEFLEFTNHLQQYLVDEVTDLDTAKNPLVETIFLCLSQIVVCIKHLERTIKAEEASGVAISASRQHFLDRIHWCLERLRVSLRSLALRAATKSVSEEFSFVELMDSALDHLAPYSTYKDSNVSNIAQQNAEAMIASKQLRSTIDQILSHTLAFANVALKEDKIALSALCQKVLRECIAFEEECALFEQELKCNDCNRKLKAMSIENALYQLEDYINEALLRLVYNTFLDYSKFSIEKLRTAIRIHGADDPALDELIADFDVNVDRTTQIGVFAIAFAPNSKIKTILRSCLASLESLDACIIPALQTAHATDIHSEILEQHFNEEVTKFKCAMQEIIDSHAFATCYYDMLMKTLETVEKKFDKIKLQEIVQMGEFLYEHFQLKVNYKVLKKADNLQCFHLYEKFVLMLRECQAILICADQVEPERIIKRFKILRSVLRRFSETLSDDASGKGKNNITSNVFIMSEDMGDSQRMFESIGISPSIPSILYCNELPMHRRRAASDSLRVNYSQMPRTPLQPSPAAPPQGRQKLQISPMIVGKRRRLLAESLQAKRELRGSVRRKESLRTSMFKRQKDIESQNLYETYKSNATSLQISDILNQLTSLSSNFSTVSKSFPEDTIISKE